MNEVSININELKRYPVESSVTDRKRYIYFLFDGDDLVYIGQANQTPHERIFQHTKSKKFTSFSYIEYADGVDLNTIERAMIGKYNPKYNRLYRTDFEKGAKRRGLRELDEEYRNG